MIFCSSVALPHCSFSADRLSSIAASSFAFPKTRIADKWPTSTTQTVFGNTKFINQGRQTREIINAFASLSFSATLLPVPSASGHYKTQKRSTLCFLAPLTPFLDASTHLYMRVCPSVRWSVGRWVTRFFQTAELEWKWHINHRISI